MEEPQAVTKAGYVERLDSSRSQQARGHAGEALGIALHMQSLRPCVTDEHYSGWCLVYPHGCKHTWFRTRANIVHMLLHGSAGIQKEHMKVPPEAVEEAWC